MPQFLKKEEILNTQEKQLHTEEHFFPFSFQYSWKEMYLNSISQRTSVFPPQPIFPQQTDLDETVKRS